MDPSLDCVIYSSHARLDGDNNLINSHNFHLDSYIEHFLFTPTGGKQPVIYVYEQRGVDR